MLLSISQFIGKFLPVRSGLRLRRGSYGALALAVLLPALMVLAACATGSNGLPSNLPIPNRGGLSFTTKTLSDGVANRSYTFFVIIAGGIAPYFCSATGLPAGLSMAPAGTTVPGGAVNGTAGMPACAITGMTAATGANNITINIADSGAPPAAATTMPPYTLTIRPEFAFAAAAALPNGVQGRTYGVAPQTAPVEATTVSGTVGNAPLTMCSVGGTGTDPSLATAVSAMTGCSLSSPSALAAAANLNLTFMATDTAIIDPATGLQVAPTHTATSGAVPLAVGSPLTVTAFALGNGEVAAAYAQTLTTNAGAGGGIGPITACSFTPNAPGGLAVAPNVNNCVVSGPPTIAFGPTTVTLNATDTGNSATPAGTAMGASTNMFQVFPKLLVSAITLGNGEVNAAYSNTMAGIPITISGGNPGSAAYTCTFAAPVAGLTIAWNNSTVAPGCIVMGAGAAGVANATFGPGTATVQVTDTAPSASSAAGSDMKTSNSFQIFSALGLSAVVLGNGQVNAAYSNTNAGTTPMNITGGNTASATYTCAFVGGVPAALSIAWNGSVAAPGCTVIGAGVGGVASATFGPATAMVTVMDMAPSAFSAAGSFTGTSNLFQIFAVLAITNPITLGNGEVNATYANKTPINITGGNPGTYVCTFVAAVSGLTVTASGTTCAVTGAGGGVANATFGPGTVSVQVTDAAPSAYSAGGPPAIGSTPAPTFQIFAQLAINGGAGVVLGNGEVNAAYSNTNPGTQPINFTGGNPVPVSYTCAFTAPIPAGLKIVWNGMFGAAAGCTVTGAGALGVASATFGPSATNVQVMDTPPSADSGSGVAVAASNSFQIYSALGLSAVVLGNGEVNAAYSNTNPGTTPMNITGGNQALGGAYTCAFVLGVPAALSIGWNGTPLPGTPACTVIGAGGGGLATAPFGPGTAMVQVMDTAPSPYSAAGSFTGTSNSFQIFAQLAVTPAITLGNGEVNAAYSNKTAITITGGNPGGYTCTFVAPPPTGLKVAAVAATCSVTGAGAANAANATFGPGTATVQVTDTAPSVYSAAGTPVSGTSGMFQIFSALTINGGAGVTLGNGQQGATYSNTNAINIMGGNPATVTYTCSFAAPVGGLKTVWNGSVATPMCNVVGAGGANVANGTFGPGTATVQAMDQAPSADSAAGTAMGLSNSFQIFAQLSIPNPFTLGNGEQGATYSNATPITITGGTSPFVCTFTAPVSGLTVVWNGVSGVGAACSVTGAGALNVANATFGPGKATIQVTDTAASADSGSSVAMGTSTTFTIFAQLMVGPVTLLNGETGAGYANSNAINITGGNAGTYVCTFTPAVSGLTVAASGSKCNVTGAAAGVANATFGPGNATIQVTDTAPSADSGSGTAMATTGAMFQIFTGVSFTNPSPFNLGNGVKGANFDQFIPFTGGNGPFACAFTAPSASPAGLLIKWDNATSCDAGEAMAPTSTFGPAAVTIQVTDTKLSADQTTPSTATTTSDAAFQVFGPLTINATRLLNGVINLAYGANGAGLTFTASGGLSGGAAVTWTQGGSVSASGNCTPPAPPPPPGLSLGAATGLLSGTPNTASATDADFTFVICVEDNTASTSTAVSTATSGPLTINIMGQLAFASGNGNNTVRVIDLAGGAEKTAITPGGGFAPRGIAVNQNGTRAYVVDNANDAVLEINTITGALTGNTADLTSGGASACASPTEIAATPDPLLNGHDLLFVLCTQNGGGNTPEVAVISSTNVAAGIVTEIAIGNFGPRNLTIQSDNSRVFVTLNTANRLFVIDNTGVSPIKSTAGGNPFPLNHETTNPTGISVVTNNFTGTLYAYIGKAGAVANSHGIQTPGTGAVEDGARTTATITTNNTSPGYSVGDVVTITGVTNTAFNGIFTILSVSGAGANTNVLTMANTAPATNATSGNGTIAFVNSEAVEVEDVTSTSAAPTFVANHFYFPSATYGTDAVAVDPSVGFVYVTFTNAANGTIFDVLDNNVASPGSISGNVANIVGGVLGAMENVGKTTATINTVTPHGLTAGTSVVTIVNVANAAFNGTFTVATTPTPTSFTVANTNPAAGTGSGGGTAIGAPFNLCDSACGTAGEVDVFAIGFTFADVPFGTHNVYFTAPTTSKVEVYAEGVPPAVNSGAQIPITGGSLSSTAAKLPARIAAIQPPF